MIYTVNEVRVKLGSLMMFILNDEFSCKYNEVASSKRDKLLIAHTRKAQADKFIVEISELLQDADKLKEITHKASNELIFTFFLRYHLLTSNLVEENQYKPMELPENDKLFFIELVNTSWLK